MTAMRHIGILAHSADGAALCFLEMVREACRRLGAHRHPEITLSMLPMGPTLSHYQRNDLEAVRTYLGRTARRLADAGCEFFVCPDNTAHIALELPGDPLPLPALHIAEIVAERAKEDGHTCVGLLGTKWTMEGPVYPAAFARHGIAMETPAPRDRALRSQPGFNVEARRVVDPSGPHHLHETGQVSAIGIRSAASDDPSGFPFINGGSRVNS